jgi:hypothetical protein
MTPERIEIGMLAASLQQAVAYRDQEPEELLSISRTIMDWACADDATRREIYRAWRNAGPASGPPQQ